MLVRFLRRFLPSQSSQNARPAQSSRPLKPRLGCDVLERRDVPSAYFWSPSIGSDLLASTATNWLDIHNNRHTAAPNGDDDLYFGSGTVDLDDLGIPDFVEEPGNWADEIDLGDQNCTIGTAGSSISFAGVHILADYTHTVKLDSLNTTITSFEQHGGNIAQTTLSESQRNNLTVTAVSLLPNRDATFDWTGGVLNSTGDAGIVTLDGVTNASIGNSTDKSYTLGSDLKLVSGTTMIASGSIVLNNDAGLVVGTGCSFDTPEEEDEFPISPPPPQPPGNPQPAGKKWVDLIAGLKGGTEGQRIDGIGMVLLEGDAAGFGRMDDPVWVTGGTLRVSKRDMNVTKNFTTKPNGAPTDLGPSVYVTDGALIITEGRTLKCSHRVEIDGTGVLSTLSDVKAPTQIAIIDANLKVNGGTVELGKNPGVLLHAASTLQILKSVQFVSGIYKPQVRATLSTECDLWKADGTFTFNAAAKIDPIVYGVVQNPGSGVNGNGVGLSWQVIYAKAGFVGVDKPATSVAADWAIDKGAANAGDPIQWASIKVNRLR